MIFLFYYLDKYGFPLLVPVKKIILRYRAFLDRQFKTLVFDNLKSLISILLADIKHVILHYQQNYVDNAK